MNKINLLDCTLRDGGYYNIWKFDNNLVQDYLNVMAKSKIDFVEIGFCFFEKNKTKGPFAYISEKILKNFEIKKSLKLAVMLNVSDTGENNEEIIKNINSAFHHKKKDRIKLVRLAFHLEELDKTILIAKILKKKKYMVGLNLMQISEIKFKKIKDIFKKIDKSFVDVFYFADSLGSLELVQTKKIINLIKKYWKKPIGIHAHDNQSLALENSKVAIKEGATFIDSTVLGMGRGPGNVKTENILSLVNRSSIYEISNLIEKHFFELKKKYNWGTNHFYYLSAKYKIHPTYIQKMLEGNRYDHNQILLAIDILKDINAKSFNPTKLNFSTKFYVGKPKGKWFPDNFKKRKILILANGEELYKNTKKINIFIKKENPIILSLNELKNSRIKRIDFITMCNPSRIFIELNNLKNKKARIIAPFSMIPKKIFSKKKINKSYDYGAVVKADKIEVNKNYCLIPNFLALSYALCIAIAGGGENIIFAGLDGYSDNVVQKKETDNTLKLFQKQHKKLVIKSLTPTKYKIKKI